MGSQIKILLIFLLSFLSLRASRADVLPVDAQAEWSRYFSGAVFFPDPEANLEKMIDAPDPRCIPLQKNIIAATVQYGRDAYKSDNPKTRKEADAILKSLGSLEDSKDLCFDSVARAYLATTVHLMNPANSNVGDLYNNYRINGHPYPLGLELTLLSAALLNHKDKDGNPTVEFLTPLRRAQENSKVWSQRTQDGSGFLVSAGYDCVDRKILIDPYLAPLNLAGTFVHELDHMFRDRIQKISIGDSQEQLYYDMKNLVDAENRLNGVTPSPTPTDPLDSHLPLKLAMDETLASAVSAFYQRHMKWFHDFRPDGLKSWLLGRPTNPYPFALTDDLTLYRNDDKGPINEIWHLLTEVQSSATSTASGDLSLMGIQSTPVSDSEINYSAADFLLLTFLRGDSYRHPTEKFPEPTAQIQNIYQTIYGGYFNGMSMTADDFAIVDPAKQDSMRDPLSKWLTRYQVQVESDNFGQQKMFQEQYDWIVNEVVQGPKKGQTSVNRIGADLEVFFYGLNEAFSQFFDSDDLSPYCSSYLAGLQDGELNAYVGNKLSSGYKPGETGVKPGETGVKPGETGVKPGETGVKPGETGVKPGETGVKPELFRPCLNIGPEL